MSAWRGTAEGLSLNAMFAFVIKTIHVFILVVHKMNNNSHTGILTCIRTCMRFPQVHSDDMVLQPPSVCVPMNRRASPCVPCAVGYVPNSVYNKLIHDLACALW
jgi:hypothetical protein